MTDIGTHIDLTADGRSICLPMDAIDVIEAISGGTKIWLRDPSPVGFAVVDQTPVEVVVRMRETHYLLKHLAAHRAKEVNR